MKIQKPKISYIEKGTFGVDEPGYREFSHGSEKPFSLRNLEIDSCIFRNVDFSNVEIEGVDVLDTVFENCDLSNKVFDDHLLQRVEFINCKLMGTTFISSGLKNVWPDTSTWPAPHCRR